MTLHDNVSAVLYGDGSFAVLVVFDAIEVRSNPVRHVSGVVR